MPGRLKVLISVAALALSSSACARAYLVGPGPIRSEGPSSPSGEVGTIRALPSTGPDLRARDMSRHFSTSFHCDPPRTLTLEDFTDEVGPGRFNRSMAVVEVLRLLPARWNSDDGERPTQAEAILMAVDPSIFTPLSLRVTRFIRGESLPETFVAFAPAGVIGDERRQSGCYFWSDGRLHAFSGAVVETGHRYLAIFGQELLSGRRTGPIERAELDALFEIVGDTAIGPGGAREEIPSR